MLKHIGMCYTFHIKAHQKLFGGSFTLLVWVQHEFYGYYGQINLTTYVMTLIFRSAPAQLGSWLRHR
jgi:hypothetical protein